jgi:hypothetical protein
MACSRPVQAQGFNHSPDTLPEDNPMRTFSSLFSVSVFAALLSFALPQMASAQNQYQGQYQGQNQNWNRLPGGGYRDTCRDIRLDRDRLTASCRGKHGGWNYAVLDIRDCRNGAVENHDGNLVCVGGYGGGRDDYGYGGLPAGGYRDTCRDIQVDRDTLSATCRGKNGGWNYTSLNLRYCRGGVVENKKGVLVCFER